MGRFSKAGWDLYGKFLWGTFITTSFLEGKLGRERRAIKIHQAGMRPLIEGIEDNL